MDFVQIAFQPPPSSNRTLWGYFFRRKLVNFLKQRFWLWELIFYFWRTRHLSTLYIKFEIELFIEAIQFVSFVSYLSLQFRNIFPMQIICQKFMFVCFVMEIFSKFFVTFNQIPSENLKVKYQFQLNANTIKCYNTPHPQPKPSCNHNP